MSTTGLEVNGGELQDFTIDQFAGALALSLGAIGSLLLVIWQSRCLCRCRVGCSDTCYIFDCSREPPQPEDEKKDTPPAEAAETEAPAEQAEEQEEEDLLPAARPQA